MITVYSVDDLVVQANQNDTYTFGFNTFLDALDGVSEADQFEVSLTIPQSYCSFSAYNESGNDQYLDQEYPDPNIGGYEGPLMCGVFKPTNNLCILWRPGSRSANIVSETSVLRVSEAGPPRCLVHFRFWGFWRLE